MNITSQPELIHVSAWRDLRVPMVSPFMLGLFADHILYIQFVPSVRSSRTSHLTPCSSFDGTRVGVRQARRVVWMALPMGRHVCVSAACSTAGATFGPSRIVYLVASARSCLLEPTRHPPSTDETNETRSLGGATRLQKSERRQEAFWPKSNSGGGRPSARRWRRKPVGGACASGAMALLWKGAVTQRLVRSSLSADQA